MTDINRQDKDGAADSPRLIDLDAGRRAFMRSVGLGAAGAAVLAGGSAISGMAHAQDSGGPSDVDILNFALNLEYLEAEFYLRGAFGRGLDDDDTTGTGDRGRVVGGRQVTFSSRTFREYAQEIARDEEAHVKFLRSALSSARVARPRLNLDTSFTRAARAAGLIGDNERFDAFGTEENFLLAAFIFEDVGVTAYKGAARFIDNKDFLEAAAGLLAVEAYHAGEIRTLLVGRGLIDAARGISKLRDAVDGRRDRDQGISLEGRVNVVPTDRNGLAFGRTPDQVLQIVYLGGRSNRFGFFPDRLNGAIR